MICPRKFNSATLTNTGMVIPFYKDGKSMPGCQCEQSGCEFWNERFGKCCMAVDSYLKGVEDSHNEAKAMRKDRW